MTSYATDLLKEPIARDHAALPDLTEETVHLHDHSTLVRDSHGSGVPIVLIHALSMDSRMWSGDGILTRLAVNTSSDDKSPRRVLAYDMRGHGQARGAPLTQSLAQLVSDLLELLDSLGLNKVDLYGVSFGGAVAQSFVLAFPERVRSAAFIATTSKGNEIMANRAVLAEANGVQSLSKQTIERWFLPETIAMAEQPDSRDGWMVHYARAGLETARAEEWAAAWRAMASLDCEGRLNEIEVHVLVLAGTQDTSTPPTMMKRTLEGCKLGEYREVDRGMHLFILENAAAAADDLIAFRARVDKTSRR
jgi:3-oxoadipate enol-lactonase